jgi:hypothetical protein
MLSVAILGLSMMSMHATAQEQKTERQIAREWKKRQRAMNPMEFKALTEEHEMLKAESTRLTTDMLTQAKDVDSLKAEVATLKNTVDVQKEAYNELMGKFEQSNQQLERAAQIVESMPAPKGKKGKAQIGGFREMLKGELLTSSKGVMFSVQVGVIERAGVAPKFNKSVILVKDESNGLQRIMMGTFRAFAQADNLKEQMRELGIKTAWVVAYKDGQRCSIKSALASMGVETAEATASR